ncbi:MAG: hypothetical protein M1833_005496 [Piccolia ochrophora]|nr:MAG: hypothetical protein M1833_005496 [Piccolia ochrophora]
MSASKTHNGDTPIEVDPSNNNNNDAPGADDETSSFTASLTSTVLDYPYENGRRYHAYQQGKYVLPNDEQETKRLDMSHHMMTLLMDEKLHLAPIGANPKRVLDIGTGTGIWCVEMGDRYPSAEILGNDLSAVQPSAVPPNVRFEIDDVEDDWAFPQPFDYIHSRYMAASIADWPRLVKRCFDNTSPGGWVEFQDYDPSYRCDDGSLKPDHAVARWIKLITQACHEVGRDPSPGPQLEGWVRDAGFTEIHSHTFKIPIGRWPKNPRLKTVGAWDLLQILEGLEGFSMALFTRTLKWTAEEVQVLLSKVREDLKNPAIHTYTNFHVVYARKPT